MSLAVRSPSFSLEEATSYATKNIPYPVSTYLRLGLTALRKGNEDSLCEAKIYFETAVESPLLEKEKEVALQLKKLFNSIESSPPWIKDLYRQSAGIKCERSINSIIDGFKKAIEQNETKYTASSIAEKVKRLSERQQRYYKSARFGFILKFFSKLRNLWKNGVYKTSAELGIWLSKDFIKNSPPPSPAPAPLASSPVPEITEKPPLAQKATKNEPLSPTISISSKEKMLTTFSSIWKRATDNERLKIRLVWLLVLKEADIVQWEELGTNTFSLKLENGLSGKEEWLPGKLLMGKEISICFSETNEGKVIAFPKKGIHFESSSQLFPNASLEKIIVVDENQVKVVGRPSRFPSWMPSLSHAVTYDRCVDFWSNIQWKPN